MDAFKRQSNPSLEKKEKNKNLFNQVGSCINLSHTQQVQDQRTPNDRVLGLETTS